MLTEKIINFAKELGFDFIGFTSIKIEQKHMNAFKKWLKNGNEAEMEYMRDISSRKNLKKLLPNAQSVIVLGVNYYHEQPKLKKGYGRIARYAYGKDYHKIILKNLKKLEIFIKEEGEKNKITIETKSYVDTGHILERAYAVQSGLGFIGKNSCLITREFGSWVFLAEIITNINFFPAKGYPSATSEPSSLHHQPASKKSSFSLCGRCTRCIDACPTKAIIAPGVIDARKCISYNTIENKGEIPSEIRKKIAKTKRIFGCDICQEVCPHNIARQKPINDPMPACINHIHYSLLNPPIAGDQLSLKKILSIKTDQHFLQTFAGSPLMRAKRKGLQRNASLCPT